MYKTWEQLSKNLKLDENNISSDDVAALKKWCKKHVSSEKTFGEDFAVIKKFLSDFFEKRSILVDEDWSASHPELDNMNFMQYAAKQGYDKCIEENLHDNPDIVKSINTQTAMGLLTPLHLAVLSGHESTAAYLLENGANPEKKNRLGQTSLHIALSVSKKCSQEEKNKKLNLFEKILFNNPNLLTATDKSGNTIFHYMAENNFYELLNKYLDRAGDLLQKKNNLGRSPMHVAMLNRQPRCVKELAKNPKNLSIKDSNGRIPLFYAVQANNLEMIQACLECETDLKQSDDYGQTLLFWANEAKNQEIKEVLESHANVFRG